MNRIKTKNWFALSFGALVKTTVFLYLCPQFSSLFKFSESKQLHEKFKLVALVSLFLTIDSFLKLIDLIILEGNASFTVNKGLELFHLVFLVVLELIIAFVYKCFWIQMKTFSFKLDIGFWLMKSILVCFDVELLLYARNGGTSLFIGEGFKLFFIEIFFQEVYSCRATNILSIFCHFLYISLRFYTYESFSTRILSFFLMFIFWTYRIMKLGSNVHEDINVGAVSTVGVSTLTKNLKSQKSKISALKDELVNLKEKTKMESSSHSLFSQYDPQNIMELFIKNMSDGCILFDEKDKPKFCNELAREYFLENFDFTIHMKEIPNSIKFEEISMLKSNFNNNLSPFLKTMTKEFLEEPNKIKLKDLLEKLRVLKKECKYVYSDGLFNDKWMTLNESIEVEVKIDEIHERHSIMPVQTPLRSATSAMLKKKKKIKKYPFLKSKIFELKLFIHALQKNNNDIICIFIDKSSERNIRNLININENKSKTISFVSHEIRTPLNCIINMLKVVENKLDEESFEKIIKPAENSAFFLLNLVNDLLDMAQIEAGKFKLNYLEFDLKMLLSDIITLIKIQAESRKIELKLNCDPRLPESIKSDPNRIRQITINLLGNALKFTTKGSIKIKAKPFNHIGDRMIKISVKDSGIGIKEEDQKKLFHAFGKVDLGENETLNIQGVGLGLLISNNLSKNLGPKNSLEGLQVKSKLGHGTKFFFIIEDKNEENVRDLAWDTRDKSPECHMNYLQTHYNTNCRIFKSRKTSIEDNSEKIKRNKNKMATIYSTDQIFMEEPENIKVSYMTQSDQLGIFKTQKPQRSFKRAENFLKEFFPNKNLMKRTQLMSEIVCTHHQNSKQSIEFLEVEEAIKVIVNQNRRRKCICPDIMIVDDNDFNILALKYHLEELHFKVESCFSGNEAITKVTYRWENNECCQRYKIIFMDIEMPGKNGIESTIEIGKFFEKRDDKQVIIGCTGYSSDKEKNECAAAGMNTMMTKPITKGALLTILTKFIDLHEESYKNFADKMSLLGIPEDKSYVSRKRMSKKSTYF